jgi:hypothetical protein
VWEPEHKGMTAALKWNSHGEAASWGVLRAEPVKIEVRPMFYGKATGHSTVEAWRGTGPSAHTRIVEITSGTSKEQQGLAATCKDQSYKAQFEIDRSNLVGRMSEYERRRLGNAGRGGARHLSEGGNTRLGQRSSRYVAGIEFGGRRLDIEPMSGGPRRCRAGGITTRARGECERALKPLRLWEGPLGKATAANRTREIRLSGMRGGPGET